MKLEELDTRIRYDVPQLGQVDFNFACIKSVCVHSGVAVLLLGRSPLPKYEVCEPRAQMFLWNPAFPTAIHMPHRTPLTIEDTTHDVYFAPVEFVEAVVRMPHIPANRADLLNMLRLDSPNLDNSNWSWDVCYDCYRYDDLLYHLVEYGDSIPSEDDVARRLLEKIVRIFPELDIEEWLCRECDDQFTIAQAVIHLNDCHKRSRSDIADWLEDIALERDIDLTFPTPENIPAEPGELKMKNLEE